MHAYHAPAVRCLGRSSATQQPIQPVLQRVPRRPNVVCAQRTELFFEAARRAQQHRNLTAEHQRDPSCSSRSPDCDESDDSDICSAQSSPKPTPCGGAVTAVGVRRDVFAWVMSWYPLGGYDFVFTGWPAFCHAQRNVDMQPLSFMACHQLSAYSASDQ